MQQEMSKIVEVAKSCGVAPITVRRWISRGLLPVIKIGHVVRVRRADLTAFLSARTSPQPMPQP